MSTHDAFPSNGGEIDPTVAGQMAQTIQSGLPLESGLRALAEQTSRASTKSALLKLASELERGVPLAAALQDRDLKLPKSMHAVATAGAHTGRIDALMHYSIGQAQRNIFLKQQIWLALSYPLFIVSMAMFYCVGLLQFVVPRFKHIFSDFGTELPGLTIFIVNLSDLVVNLFSNEWEMFLLRFGMLILFFVVLISLLSKWGQANISSFPLIGPVFRYAAMSDFCRVLALLIDSGVPFPTALKTAAMTSEDHWIISKCNSISHQIENGASPYEAARRARMPATLAQILQSAFSESSLVQGLRGLSDIYAAQSFLDTRIVASTLVPVVTVSVALFVGLITLSLFMPLIKLLNDLS